MRPVGPSDPFHVPGVDPDQVEAAGEDRPPRAPLPTDAPDEAPTGATAPIGDSVSPIASRRASTFDVRRARFTFGGRVQLGALNLLVGIGGLNKSTATARLTADATTGRLDGDLADTPTTVLFASAEDGTETVTVPRLVAAGADLGRVVVPDEPIILPDDVARLGALVDAEDVDLVVIDPLVAFLDGATDSHNDASVRQALAALRPLTEDRELTSLAVMHLNKTRARDTYTRISGSAGFFNAARSVMAMTADPRDRDDELARVVWHEKANAGPKARPQSATVVPVDVDATDGEAVPTIRLDLGDWLDGLDIGDALDPTPERAPTKAEQAEALLSDLLADGPRLRSDLEAAAAKARVSWRTVEAAKAALHVESRQVPEPGRQGRGPSWWKLPGTEWSAAARRTHIADHSLSLDGPQPPDSAEPENGPQGPQGTGDGSSSGEEKPFSRRGGCVECGGAVAAVDLQGRSWCADHSPHGGAA